MQNPENESNIVKNSTLNIEVSFQNKKEAPIVVQNTFTLLQLK